jgi:hypothetical protein
MFEKRGRSTTSGACRVAKLASLVSILSWICCSRSWAGDLRPAPQLTLESEAADADWSPAAVKADLAKSGGSSVAAFNLDNWVGWNPQRGGVNVGLALVFPWKKLRPGLLVAPNELGCGIAYVLVPVIDFGIGGKYTFDPRSGEWTGGIYASLFKF